MIRSIFNSCGLIQNPHTWRYRGEKIMKAFAMPAIAGAISVSGMCPLELLGNTTAFAAVWGAKSARQCFFRRFNPETQIPSGIWEQLEKSNREKGPDAPGALILQAKDDHNGACTTPASNAHLLQIAKTHRVAFRVFRHTYQIQEAIDTVSEQMPIDAVFIKAHGSADSLSCGEAPLGHTYTKFHDHAKLFGKMRGDRIYLQSCSTG